MASRLLSFCRHTRQQLNQASLPDRKSSQDKPFSKRITDKK